MNNPLDRIAGQFPHHAEDMRRMTERVEKAEKELAAEKEAREKATEGL